MREKQKRMVVTFRTTAGAMAMEKTCHEKNLPGRLIPVPRVVTAGCGMCWAAPMEAWEFIEKLVMEERLDVDGLYEIRL